jgi:hypothetical protein
MSPEALGTLEEALRELRDLERVLRPWRRDGEEMAETVRRLVAEQAKAKPALAAVPRTASALGGLKTAKQIVTACPALTKDSLKKMMFHSKTNGLEAHLLRLGRRVLIDEQGFLAWLRGRRRRAA